jgi:hypothetical protein
MEVVARERQAEALQAAHTERWLTAPSSGEQFNHYHYWPETRSQADLQAGIDKARVDRLVRSPSLWDRLGAAVGRALGRPTTV